MDPEKSDAQQAAETNGWDGWNSSPNQYGGEHNTVYNDVARESWDTDSSGSYVSSDSQGRETHHQVEVRD